MTTPIGADDPLAVIAAQQVALAAATWVAVNGVDGVQAAEVQGAHAVRPASASGPVLWFVGGEWDAVLAGDDDARALIAALAV